MRRTQVPMSSQCGSGAWVRSPLGPGVPLLSRAVPTPRVPRRLPSHCLMALTTTVLGLPLPGLVTASKLLFLTRETLI